jgi:cytoskeleton protein RodZ
VGSFGERLQREREMRGITLEEIAEATKIGTRSLRALEEEDFDKLPGGIFNKGFVRAYSRYLGIDEEQAVADYAAALADAQLNGRLARPEMEDPTRPDKHASLGKVDDEQPRLQPMVWAALAALVIVVAAGFATARYVARHGWPQLRRPRTAIAQPSQPPAATPAATNPALPVSAAALPQPDQAEPATTAATPAASVQDGFLLRVHAKQEAWVLLIADGKQEMSGVLAAGAEKAVRARKEVVFKTGNAAAIELFQNDQPLPLLGNPQQVKQVTITAQGMQDTKNPE